MMNARIVAVRWQSVAVVFSVVYGLVGVGFFFWNSFKQAPEMLAPFGVFVPFTQFTFNLHLVRSNVIEWNFLWGAIQTFAYAVSGFLTGAIFAFLFNFAIWLTGGIDAKYVRVGEIERTPGHVPMMR
jgi:hypothetical protein